MAQGLYLLNRWGVKPVLPSGFFHDYFNDLLLIPAALPCLLWLHARLGWRPQNAAPTAWEVGFHCVVWSLLCEAVGPWLFARGTADPKDVLAYAAGAILAWCWWRRGAGRHAVSLGTGCGSVASEAMGEPLRRARGSA